MRSDTVGIGLIVLGCLAFVGLRALNDQDDWILASLELPLASTEFRALEFTARTNGYAEIQIELDASSPQELHRAYVFPTDTRSELEIRWEVLDDSHTVAAGGAGDYLYIERMPSLLGRVRRSVMQVPFGRDEAHWNSLGLTGSRMTIRGIGRVLLEAGKRYELRVNALDDYPDLVPWSPILVLRVDRREWQGHYERVRALGISPLHSSLRA